MGNCKETSPFLLDFTKSYFRAQLQNKKVTLSTESLMRATIDELDTHGGPTYPKPSMD
ncbi:hypothetical protein AVEN_261533-1, partial [Araneus ventricosus]